MASHLCSTFLNATSVPEFPGDISAFVSDKHYRDDAVDKESAASGVNERSSGPSGAVTGENLLQSIQDGALSELSIVPQLKAGSERQEQIAKVRATNQYVDTLEKMREISNRRTRKNRHSALKDQLRAIDNKENAEGDIGTALDVVRLCDQIVRKSALYQLKRFDLEKEQFWNQSGLSNLLTPELVEKDLKELERVVTRLENLMTNIPKMAVCLQKPPVPSLRLDPRLHEAAAKLLGDAGLKLALDIANATEKVELFARATGSESSSSLAKDLAREVVQNQNLVAHVMTTLNRAVDVARENRVVNKNVSKTEMGRSR